MVSVAFCHVTFADPPRHRTYTVRSGDTLTGIARRELGDASRAAAILEANPTLRNAHRIYPGQRLRLPDPGSIDPSQESYCGGVLPPSSSPSDADRSVTSSDPGGPAPGDSGWDELVTTIQEIPVTLGLAGMGVGAILLISIACQLVVYFLVGAFLLWLGAIVTRVPKLEFGKCFKVNAVGTIVSIVAAAVLWGGVGLLALSEPGKRWLPQDLGELLLAAIAAYVMIQSFQLLVYVLMVRRGLDIRFLHACFACMLACSLQLLFGASTGVLVGL